MLCIFFRSPLARFRAVVPNHGATVHMSTMKVLSMVSTIEPIFSVIINNQQVTCQEPKKVEKHCPEDLYPTPSGSFPTSFVVVVANADLRHKKPENINLTKKTSF